MYSQEIRMSESFHSLFHRCHFSYYNYSVSRAWSSLFSDYLATSKSSSIMRFKYLLWILLFWNLLSKEKLVLHSPFQTFWFSTSSYYFIGNSKRCEFPWKKRTSINWKRTEKSRCQWECVDPVLCSIWLWFYQYEFSPEKFEDIISCDIKGSVDDLDRYGRDSFMHRCLKQKSSESPSLPNPGLASSQ